MARVLGREDLAAAGRRRRRQRTVGARLAMEAKVRAKFESREAAMQDRVTASRALVSVEALKTRRSVDRAEELEKKLARRQDVWLEDAMPELKKLRLLNESLQTDQKSLVKPMVAAGAALP